jgi:hypothetical protein
LTTTLLTTVEVAERLGLSAAAVTQAVRSGQLEATARTAEDFLFSERSVIAFEQSRAEAAAAPADPAPEGSRGEWTSELGRLNGWLVELNASMAPSEGVEVRSEPIRGSQQAPEAGPTVQQPAPAASSQPTDVPVQTPVAMETALPEPHPSQGLPVAGPTAEEPPPSPQRALPEPGPRERPAIPDAALILEVAAERPVHDSADRAPRRPTPSRQVILVVQPIERFRTLAELAKVLSTLPGLADARLESIDRGVAGYRLTMADEPATEADITAAIAGFSLRAMLVEPGE